MSETQKTNVPFQFRIKKCRLEAIQMRSEFWLEDSIVFQNQNPVPASGLRRLQGTAVSKHAPPTTRPSVRPVATAKPRSLARS